jgi:hypothetical protein
MCSGNMEAHACCYVKQLKHRKQCILQPLLRRHLRSHETCAVEAPVAQVKLLEGVREILRRPAHKVPGCAAGAALAIG